MAHIAIIGTGRMALNLGIGWSRSGQVVVFGSRNPGDKADIETRVAGARVTTHIEALAAGEVVVIALPYVNVEPFARQYAAQLQGKLVIDISNPFSHLPDNRISGAEITAAAIGSNARVVAAFKDNFWKTLLEPVDARGMKRDVHFAGDHADDKKIVAGLIEALGFQPIDCGPLKYARVLDVMVPLMIELDRRYAHGEGKSSWKFST
jgi:hypothetical protein